MCQSDSRVEPYLNHIGKKNEKTQKEKGKIHHKYSQIGFSRTRQASRSSLFESKRKEK